MARKWYGNINNRLEEGTGSGIAKGIAQVAFLQHVVDIYVNGGSYLGQGA